MSYQVERENFIAFMVANGKDAETARQLLRMAATHGRLAVASCNGDYPADNGERRTKECPNCGCHWVPSSFKKGMCPDCYTESRILEHAQANGYAVEFQGDPRGYTVRVTLNGREVGVPQRG